MTQQTSSSWQGHDHARSGKHRALLALAFLAVASTRAAGALPGDLDLTFGDDGVVLTDFTAGQDSAFAVLIQPDGKVVAAGVANWVSSNDDIALARYAADGSLDASFGSGGTVQTDLGGTTEAVQAAALQPDGKIVVVGSVFAPPADTNYAVVRYNPDGSLDAGFGVGGVVTADLDAAVAVAIQSDGRIVVAGGSGVTRHLPDGTLDGSFGSGGTVLAGAAVAVAIQADGRIVTGGTAAVRRYLADGTPDPTFGIGGAAAVPSPRELKLIKGLALQPDGKIVLAGHVFSAGVFPLFDIMLVRYDSSGMLDPSFDGDGILLTDINGTDDVAEAIAIQSDGRLVVVGNSFGRLTVLRYEMDGSLDAGFGGDPIAGATMLDSDLAGLSRGLAVALQADGRIVAAGGTDDSSGGTNPSFNDRFVIVRRTLATCGNGLLEPGEPCEDGNLSDGDGCDSNCTVTACGNDIVTAGEQCDDGNTSGGDCCDAGCQFPSCPRAALATQLALKRGGSADQDKLLFKWNKGDPTSAVELGDPTAATAYRVCLRDDSGLVWRGQVAPGGSCDGKPCWKPVAKGYKFLDKSKRNDGITQILLKGSDDPKAKVLVKGQGNSLSLFDVLPLSPPVAVQLVNGDTGLCFEGSYGAAQIDTNDEKAFKAKAP